jgi:mono/diheme cytochrome c family protein
MNSLKLAATFALVLSSAAHANAAVTYTAAQAAAGAKSYGENCSRCHGAQLQGVSAPALKGDGSGIKGDTLAEAYNFLSVQMPAGNPGSLSTNDYVNITAYILSKDGHKPGSAKLTPALAKTDKTIKF